MTVDLSAIPEPQFVHRDAERVLKECIEFVESRTGRPLEPEQRERLLVDLLVYREMVWRESLQDTGKQNLVAYAAYPMIDHIAALIGEGRIAAEPAVTKIQFTFESPLEDPLPIPLATRIRTKDRKATFTTDSEVVLSAGATGVLLAATCTTAGKSGNGYAPGQVAELLDPLGVAVTVENTTTTAGGAASEDSERLRERVPGAVRGLSVAGPGAAYTALARKAHPDIIDVTCVSPEPGLITLNILAVSGEPDPAVVDAVDDYFDDEEVNPFDDVTAVAAEAFDYVIDAQLTLSATHKGVEETAAALAAAQIRINAYVQQKRERLKDPPDISQIYSKLAGPGIHKSNLIGWVNFPLASHQFANATEVTLSVVGYES